MTTPAPLQRQNRAQPTSPFFQGLFRGQTPLPGNSAIEPGFGHDFSRLRVQRGRSGKSQRQLQPPARMLVPLQLPWSNGGGQPLLGPARRNPLDPWWLKLPPVKARAWRNPLRPWWLDLKPPSVQTSAQSFALRPQQDFAGKNQAVQPGSSGQPASPALAPASDDFLLPIDLGSAIGTDLTQYPQIKNTQDFQLALVWRDVHLSEFFLFGRRVELGKEPSLFLQASFTPQAGTGQGWAKSFQSATVGLSGSILNSALMKLHGKELLEVAFDAQGGVQKDPAVGTALVGQAGPTVQFDLSNWWRQTGAKTVLTANISGQITVPLGKQAAPQQATVIPLVFSLGFKVQF